MAEDDSNPFEGTEAYYAEHRPEYGEDVIRYLCDRFGVDDSARVLDLGCGAGQLAVPLAEYAGEVVGMDPNEEMLRRAEKRAKTAERENVEWVVGSDADLREGCNGGDEGDEADEHADLGPLRLTTMGRSFHWMDREPTLDHLHRTTESGGGVALVTDSEWLTKGTRDWQAEVYEVVGRYLDDLPPRTGPVEEYDDPWDELLEDRGFGDVEVGTFESEREWDIDGIVGYVLSLSFCSPEVFGEEKEEFEADLRRRLGDREDKTFTQSVEIDVTSGRVYS